MIAEDAILKTDATGHLIEQIKTSGNHELVICTKLAKLLPVDFSVVWICFTATTDMVEAIFKMQGIPELEVVNHSTNHSWLHGRDHHALTPPLSNTQAGVRTAEVATNNQRSTLDPLYARLNDWHNHKQPPTPMTHDPQGDFDPHGKTNREVGVATSSRSLIPTTRDQHDQDNRDRTPGVGTSSRSPTLIVSDLQPGPSLQEKTNRMPVVVTSSRSPLPVTHDHVASPPDKTDRTSGVVTSGRSPTPIIHDLQQDTSPRDKTNRTAGVVASGQDPTPATRDLQHDPILQDKMDRTPGVVTNSRNATPITRDPQCSPSPQDEADRTPAEVAGTRGPTPMASDPKDDLSPQDNTDQAVGTNNQSPTPQAHDQYNLRLQQTMNHPDPVVTTTYPGEVITQSEGPMPPPPSLFPIMPPYHVDPARTSFVYLAPSLDPNISLPINRPETFNDAQFLAGGCHTGDSPSTGQHIRDGIDGEHFVSSAAVVPWLS